MERTKALALAGATTLVLGTSIVAASAMGGLGLLGFGASEASGIGAFTTAPTTVSAPVVTRTRDVYDKYVVDDGTATTVAGASTSGVAGGAPGASGDAPGTPAANPFGSADPGAPEPPESPPTTSHVDDPAPTTAPAPPTTGHEDDGWPPGSTVPPPPNCVRAHWDDGHWVCGGDD